MNKHAPKHIWGWKWKEFKHAEAQPEKGCAYTKKSAYSVQLRKEDTVLSNCVKRTHENKLSTDANNHQKGHFSRPNGETPLS